MTHITCKLTAENRDQLRKPTLGNRVWATFTFSSLQVAARWRGVVYSGDQPPQVKAHYPATMIVQLGSTVRISCPVYGSPRSLVSWTKDSDTVHLGWQRFHLQRAGASLYVKDIRPTDAGRYTCTATNGFGTATVTIDLHVVRELLLSSLRSALRKLFHSFTDVYA